jgi:hypothetical protein
MKCRRRVRADHVEVVQVVDPVVAWDGALEELRDVVEVLRAREVCAEVPFLLVGGVEVVRGYGLVARRVDEEVEAVERALRRILRRRADVGVEEHQARGEVVVLAVFVLRAVDVDVAVAGGEAAAEVVFIERARDGRRRRAQHERGERGDAVADPHGHGAMKRGSVFDPWMLA